MLVTNKQNKLVEAYAPKYLRHPMSTPFWGGNDTYTWHRRSMNSCQPVTERFFLFSVFDRDMLSSYFRNIGVLGEMQYMRGGGVAFVNCLAAVHRTRVQTIRIHPQNPAWTFGFFAVKVQKNTSGVVS